MNTNGMKCSWNILETLWHEVFMNYSWNDMTWSVHELFLNHNGMKCSWTIHGFMNYSWTTKFLKKLFKDTFLLFPNQNECLRQACGKLAASLRQACEAKLSLVQACGKLAQACKYFNTKFYKLVQACASMRKLFWVQACASFLVTVGLWKFQSIVHVS